jgi:type VI secretion system protein ImpK
MIDEDDPFGLGNDAGRTRIRPVSRPAAGAATGHRATQGWQGGRQEPAVGAYAADAGAARPVRRARTRPHPNPLVSAFAPLLEIAPELERAAAPSEPSALRARLLDGLIVSRDAAVAAGVALARADQAAWFVAALLDDLALNTPWGGNSDWPRQPLVVSLAGEVDAGVRFFERMEELMRYPERDREMLELGLACLSLGFRGRHRVEGRGAQGALLQIRGAAARLLRAPDGGHAALSPNWEGVLAPDETRRFAVPIWTLWIGAAAIAVGIYVALGMRLGDRAEQTYALARAIPPAERAEIFRPVRGTDPVAPPPELTVTSFELLPEFARNAPPDTVRALSGREDVSLSVLVMQATDPEVFRSAKAELNDAYESLVASIARTILENVDVIGGVTVIGHTDSVPVQRTNPFASNQRLSEARAETIARMLVAAGVPAALVRSEGRAAAEPIADNATAEGRARNRRVEIRLEKTL